MSGKKFTVHKWWLCCRHAKARVISVSGPRQRLVHITDPDNELPAIVLDRPEAQWIDHSRIAFLTHVHTVTASDNPTFLQSAIFKSRPPNIPSVQYTVTNSIYSTAV